MTRALKTVIRRTNPLKPSGKPTESALKRAKNARKALKHREKCLEQAEMVRNGTISVRAASTECGVSERQMARHVAKVTKEKQQCSAPATANSHEMLTL